MTRLIRFWPLVFFCVLFFATSNAQGRSEQKCQTHHFPGSDLNSGATLNAQSDRKFAHVAAMLQKLGMLDQNARAPALRGEKLDWTSVSSVDKENEKELKKIIDEYGLLGLGSVGGKAVQGEFYVIQHSTNLGFQKKMLKDMKKMYTSKDFPGDYIALLEDRIRVQEGRSQLYGTQTRSDWSPYPISDKANLDKRRAQHGLPPFSTQECVYKKFMPSKKDGG